MRTRKKIILALCAAALLALVIWTVWGNTALVLTEYTVQDPDIPAAFDGFRIVQVSDLHNGEFGRDNGRLLELIRAAQPDIIAITGDLIDSRHTDIPVALAFAERAVEIAPCYYVTGNHESRMEAEYAQLKAGLLALGVAVLENEKVKLDRSGETIQLLGVLDPAFETHYRTTEAATMEKNLASLSQEGYQILLSHRPEFMDLYTQYDIDLVLSGHAHGGQVRLPYIGGLFAPSQGIFPKYDGGLFEEGQTKMLVSRGIGSSIIPLRFNNRPEVVLITLTQ